ncbi:hypothetical protein ABXK61_16230 [Burkholderia sola]|uniref:hypothetical protein n=1 Tax=Burkholderia TaxID=32008 RepID=UPI001AEADD25|nr:hypothetical protein [Burkholderia sp. AcTa6-5]MBP0714854.1 hypothetical protein [Burkholderia sp. AcTa6-5]
MRHLAMPVMPAMYTSKHTPPPWRAEAWNRHTRTTVVVDDSSIVTGKRVIAEFETEEDAAIGACAADMTLVLDMIGEADDDARAAGRPMLNSALRAALDAVLIKAGIKDAPEPMHARLTR